MRINSDLVMRWRGAARWRRRTMAVAALAVPLAALGATSAWASTTPTVTATIGVGTQPSGWR